VIARAKVAAARRFAQIDNIIDQAAARRCYGELMGIIRLGDGDDARAAFHRLRDSYGPIWSMVRNGDGGLPVVRDWPIIARLEARS
jgi:hypothetical protein